jgi:hypothetical protein
MFTLRLKAACSTQFTHIYKGSLLYSVYSYLRRQRALLNLLIFTKAACFTQFTHIYMLYSYFIFTLKLKAACSTQFTHVYKGSLLYSYLHALLIFHIYMKAKGSLLL